MKLFFPLLSLLFTASLGARQKDTTLRFYSSFVKDSFTVRIGFIEKGTPRDSFYPVYTLDGDETFAGAKLAFNTVKNLRKNILLVSIGYGAAYGQKGNKRDRDYSPVRSDTSAGKRFFNFISKELVPVVDKNYRTKTERTFVGYSAGANFCLYALLTHQAAFTNYMAGSLGASLDSSYFFSLLTSAKLHQQGTKLFLSAGAKEDWATDKMAKTVEALKRKNTGAILIKEQIFEGREHGLVGAFLFLKEGFTWLFIKD